MKKSLIALAALAALGAYAPVRARTHDVSFTYRMGAGFPGDVNRTHPAAILPVMVNATNPPASYGVAVLFNTADNTVRGLLIADASDATPVKVAGVIARPFPVQQGTPAGAFGQQLLTDATSVPTNVPQDYLQGGRIMVKVNGAGGAALTIDSDVYVWCAASGGGHVLGGFEPAFSAGNTVKVSNAKYRGPSDASGVAELEVWI